MITKSPALASKSDSAASNIPVKVRRFVVSDIPKIIELAEKKEIDIPFSRKRLSFILNNNLKNALLYVGVLIDLNEVAGILISDIRMTFYSDEKIATCDLFYIHPDYEEYLTLMKHEFYEWARERGVKYAMLENKIEKL
jgi:hypothetical protein